MTINSPADAVRYLLIQNGVAETGSRHSPEGLPPGWGIVTGEVPDEPDNYVGVLDTGGFYDGRIQRTGETVYHATVQVYIRSESYPVGHLKGQEIKGVLDAAHRVSFPGWLLEAVTVMGTITYLGMQEKRRRTEFALNARMTLTPVTT